MATRLLVARLQPVLVALAGIIAESVIVGGIGAWPTPHDQPLLIAVMNAVIALSRVDIAWINVARHRTPLRTPHSITLDGVNARFAEPMRLATAVTAIATTALTRV